MKLAIIAAASVVLSAAGAAQAQSTKPMYCVTFREDSSATPARLYVSLVFEGPDGGGDHVSRFDRYVSEVMGDRAPRGSGATCRQSFESYSAAEHALSDFIYRHSQRQLPPQLVRTDYDGR